MTKAALSQLDRAAAEFIGRDPNELATMIIDIMREAEEASRAHKRFHASSLYDRVYAIRRRLALDFGALHGWRLSRSEFGLQALARGGVSGGSDWWCAPPRPYFDHSYFYRVGRRAAAIATHPYDVDEAEWREFAWANRLWVEFPNYPSWWFPGHTKFVLCIGPRGISPDNKEIDEPELWVALHPEQFEEMLAQARKAHEQSKAVNPKGKLAGIMIIGTP